MTFAQLLAIAGGEPVFETSLLLAGAVDRADVRRQLSRWTRSGRVLQLRRGVYALAPPYRRTTPHPFVIANRIVRPSYVSCQAALAHYGLIPEHVPVVTSVTTGRPGRWVTALGTFEFRHVTSALWSDYQWLEFGGGQGAFVATPEKALLDLVHLQPGADTPAYLRELRLQNLDHVDLTRLEAIAARTARPKLRRAAARIVALAREESADYAPLDSHP
jgi:hypothetical protein